MATTTKKAAKKAVRRHTAPLKATKRTPRKWSAKVTQTSDALDLRTRIFQSTDPDKVARSLKRSAEKSTRRKGTPLQSAMSMLNFYINRAGKNLPATQRKVLTRAKDALRKLFGRPPKKKSKKA